MFFAQELVKKQGGNIDWDKTSNPSSRQLRRDWSQFWSRFSNGRSQGPACFYIVLSSSSEGKSRHCEWHCQPWKPCQEVINSLSAPLISSDVTIGDQGGKFGRWIKRRCSACQHFVHYLRGLLWY